MKDVSLDILLAMDYVISMQYFRIFRWDSCLLGVDESKHILQPQPAALQQFQEGLSVVFGKLGLSSALHAMLKIPIRAAFDAQGDTTSDEADEAGEHWLCSAYKDLQQQYSLPDWPKAYNEKLEEWGAFSKGALKVWLLCKLEAEYRSRRVGQHNNERDRQFTETDRLIKSLLETKLYSQAENTDALDLPGDYQAQLHVFDVVISNSSSASVVIECYAVVITSMYVVWAMFRFVLACQAIDAEQSCQSMQRKRT